MSYLQYIPQEYMNVFSQKATFKTWFESRYQYLPPEILNQYHMIIDKFETDKEIITKAFEHHVKRIVARLDYQDKIIYIWSGYISSRSYYDEENSRIVILFNDNLDVMNQDLLHELGHLVDKGLPWKNKNYNKDPQTEIEKTVYALEPAEFDAMGTHIAELIKAIFRNKDDAGKLEIIKVIENWLRNGGDIPYIEPSIIEKWKTDPKLWRKFQERMYNLLSDLKNS